MNQQMRLEQKLTPRLIQSMAILQKPVADLEAHVAEALETNAALEVVGDDVPQTEDNEASDRESKIPKSAEEYGFARAERYRREFDSDESGFRPRAASSDEIDPKLAAMANTEGRPESLQEHLLGQWSLLDMDDATRHAGETIINRLDPDGYLRADLNEVAATARPPVEPRIAEDALTLIHDLDPPGIGARTTVECLLLQLDRLPGDNNVERTLITQHLDDIAHNRLPQIAKVTGYGVGEIIEAIRVMRSKLVLHPGYLISKEGAPPVRPDVIIEFALTGSDLIVRLARGNAPELRIRGDVAALAKSSDKPLEVREFARKHVEEASALIDAVQFRRRRVLQVAEAIVQHQREFFDSGPSGLKTLKMSDLAPELKCDPSTISRAVADKYMQTPWGIYPMRYFFTGGTETEEGESIGWDRIKSRVKEVVEGEDKDRPLSDDQIATMLAKEGLDISRRTVAKYRQQLDIPAAKQRKSFR